jgi:glycosidase
MDWYTDERGAGMTTWFRPPDRNNRRGDGISVEEQEQSIDSLLGHYRRLIRLRAAHPALRQGGCERVTVIGAEGYVLAYLRQDVQDHLLIVLNLSHVPVDVACAVGQSSLPAGPWSAGDLLGDATLQITSGAPLRVHLDAQHAQVWELSRP